MTPILLLLLVGFSATPFAGAQIERGQETVSNLPDLPLAITSFGASILDHTIYVFGGHTGRAHQHSFENLSQMFLALDLRQPEARWAALPPGPAVQGTALAAHNGLLYRVGGLRALNPRGVEEDLFSLATAEAFDPGTSRWIALPDLPSGRSSHDVAVLNDQLLIVGGWEMRGKSQDPVWAQEVLALDLKTTQSAVRAWRVITKLPSPRRALSAVAHNGQLFVLGGLSDSGTLSMAQSWDPGSGLWNELPDLPEAGSMRGFAADAVSTAGQLLITQSDGKIHRLTDDGTWSNVGQLEGARFFHQLLATEHELIAVGGASRRSHLADLERVDLRTLGIEFVAESGGDWTGFRNRATSTFNGTLPTEWADETVTWSQELVGFGQSSPVVRDGVVYITSVSGEQKDTLWLTALKLKDGAQLWRQRWSAAETMESGDMIARAAPTPGVDESGLVLLYGSGDLFATDHEGERVWHRDLVSDYGTFTGNHGVANSVLLAEDKAIVLLARKTYSYLLAVDRFTGKTLWKADREPGVSWTTPVLSPDRQQVIVSSNGSVEAYAVADGTRTWWLPGVESNTTQSPTVTDDYVLVAGSDAAANFALQRRQLEGEVDAKSIAWHAEATSNFGSPVLSSECAYWVNKAGVVHCLEPNSGKALWRHRLPETIWATPILADNRLYVFGEDGATTVLADSAKGPKVISVNALTMASRLHAAAAAEETLLLRSGTKLFAIR